MDRAASVATDRAPGVERIGGRGFLTLSVATWCLLVFGAGVRGAGLSCPDGVAARVLEGA